MLDIIHWFLVQLMAAPKWFWYFWLPFGFFSGWIYEAMAYTKSVEAVPKHIVFLLGHDRGPMRQIFLFCAAWSCFSVPYARGFLFIIGPSVPKDWFFANDDWRSANPFGWLIGLALYVIVMDPFGIVAWIREPPQLGLPRVKRS